jgi:hypothetical protein
LTISAAQRLAGVDPQHPAVRITSAVLAALVEPCGLDAASCGAEGLARDRAGVLAGGHPAAEIANLLDGGEQLRAVAASFRMALTLFDDHQAWAVGLEDLEGDQKRDLTHRLLVVGLLACRLFPGSIEQRAAALLDMPEGKVLAAWIGAVELGLAFAMEDEPLDGDLLPDALDDHLDDVARGVAELASPDEIEAACALARALVPALTALVEPAVARIGGIAEALRAALPELSEQSTDAMAAEVEATPVYLLLVAQVLEAAGTPRGELAPLVVERDRAPAPPEASASEPDDHAEVVEDLDWDFSFDDEDDDEEAAAAEQPDPPPGRAPPSQPEPADDLDWDFSFEEEEQEASPPQPASPAPHPAQGPGVETPTVAPQQPPAATAPPVDQAAHRKAQAALDEARQLQATLDQRRAGVVGAIEGLRGRADELEAANIEAGEARQRHEAAIAAARAQAEGLSSMDAPEPGEGLAALRDALAAAQRRLATATEAVGAASARLTAAHVQAGLLLDARDQARAHLAAASGRERPDPQTLRAGMKALEAERSQALAAMDQQQARRVELSQRFDALLLEAGEIASRGASLTERLDHLRAQRDRCLALAQGGPEQASSIDARLTEVQGQVALARDASAALAPQREALQAALLQAQERRAVADTHRQEQGSRCSRALAQRAGLSTDVNQAGRSLERRRAEAAEARLHVDSQGSELASLERARARAASATAELLAAQRESLQEEMGTVRGSLGRCASKGAAARLALDAARARAVAAEQAAPEHARLMQARLVRRSQLQRTLDRSRAARVALSARRDPLVEALEQAQAARQRARAEAERAGTPQAKAGVEAAATRRAACDAELAQARALFSSSQALHQGRGSELEALLALRAETLQGLEAALAARRSSISSRLDAARLDLEAGVARRGGLIGAVEGARDRARQAKERLGQAAEELDRVGLGLGALGARHEAALAAWGRRERADALRGQLVEARSRVEQAAGRATVAERAHEAARGGHRAAAETHQAAHGVFEQASERRDAASPDAQRVALLGLVAERTAAQQSLSAARQQRLDALRERIDEARAARARGLDRAALLIDRRAARRRAGLQAALDEAHMQRQLFEDLCSAAREHLQELGRRLESGRQRKVEAEERLALSRAQQASVPQLPSESELVEPLIERRSALRELLLSVEDPRRFARRKLEQARVRTVEIEQQRVRLRPRLDERYGWLKQLRMEGGRLARGFPEVGRAVAAQRRRIAVARELLEGIDDSVTLQQVQRERRNAEARWNQAQERVAAARAARDRLAQQRRLADDRMAEIEERWELCHRRVRVRSRRLDKVLGSHSELFEQLARLEPPAPAAPPPAPALAPPPPPPPIVPRHLDEATVVLSRAALEELGEAVRSEGARERGEPEDDRGEGR